MQHDSNLLETGISKFPTQLAEDMYNQSSKFDAILHIPTIHVGDHVSEQFEDFLSSMDSKNADDLIEKHPQFKELIESFIENTDRSWNQEHAINLVEACHEFEFLVLVQSAIPRNFDFTDQGKFRSCSYGGHYRIDWIFAKDMKHAAEQAILISEEIQAEAEEKARKEQGIKVEG